MNTPSRKRNRYCNYKKSRKKLNPSFKKRRWSSNFNSEQIDELFLNRIIKKILFEILSDFFERKIKNKHQLKDVAEYSFKVIFKKILFETSLEVLKEYAQRSILKIKNILSKFLYFLMSIYIHAIAINHVLGLDQNVFSMLWCICFGIIYFYIEKKYWH